MLRSSRVDKRQRLKHLKILLTYLLSRATKRLVSSRLVDPEPKPLLLNKTQQNKSKFCKFHDLVSEMRLWESLKFFNYHGMTIDLFDELMEKTEGTIAKCSTKEVIPAGTRLSLTLRYLASGEMMKSLSQFYKVSPASATKIIAETCRAIYESLFRSAFGILTEEKWRTVESGFRNTHNFPNCIGAIDGRNCAFQTFGNAGRIVSNSRYLNTIPVMTICDADYNFLVVDVGEINNFNDCGVFKTMAFGKALMNGESFLNIPPDKNLPGTNLCVPHVIVGDETFPMSSHLMRPFSERNLVNGLLSAEDTYNYRLSRPKQVTENAFGILSAKWRIFKAPIHAKKETVDKIVRATMALHNWIKNNSSLYCDPGFVDYENDCGEIVVGRWRLETAGDGEQSGMQSIFKKNVDEPDVTSINIREKFKIYFSEYDTLPIAPQQSGLHEVESYFDY